MKYRLLFFIAILTILSNVRLHGLLKITVENKTDKIIKVSARSNKGHTAVVTVRPGEKSKLKDITLGISLAKINFGKMFLHPLSLAKINFGEMFLHPLGGFCPSHGQTVEYNIPPELGKGAVWYLIVDKMEDKLIKQVGYGWKYDVKNFRKMIVAFELYKGSKPKGKPIIKTTQEKDYEEVVEVPR